MMLPIVFQQQQCQNASALSSMQSPPRTLAPRRLARRTLRGFVTLLTLTTLVCGVGPARAQDYESGVAVEEAVEVYLHECFTALQALMQRKSHRHLPSACEDERLRLQQPEAVVSSSVSTSRAGVLIDVTLVDQGHVVFDGNHTTPGDPADHRASDLSARLIAGITSEPVESTYTICVESGNNFWCYQPAGNTASFGCMWYHDTFIGCGVRNWYQF
jgi:hypothetical protein